MADLPDSSARRDLCGGPPARTVPTAIKALQFAPATYYAAISCQASARQQRDDELKVEIARVHRDNFSVYGIEKVWHQLNREGIQVGRDRVHRLMGRDGPRGRGPWQTEAHHHHLQRGGPAT